MLGWHHQLNGHEFEQTPEDSEGHGSLACCNSWGHKESDNTEQQNNNDSPSRSWGEPSTKYGNVPKKHTQSWDSLWMKPHEQLLTLGPYSKGTLLCSISLIDVPWWFRQ